MPLYISTSWYLHQWHLIQFFHFVSRYPTGISLIPRIICSSNKALVSLPEVLYHFYWDITIGHGMYHFTLMIYCCMFQTQTILYLQFYPSFKDSAHSLVIKLIFPRVNAIRSMLRHYNLNSLIFLFS